MQALKLTKKYEQYSEYKDSGVDWLGEIPKEWDTRKFKFIAKYQKGKNPEDLSLDQIAGTVPYLSMEYLRGSSQNVSFADPTQKVLANKSDLVLLWDGSNAGEFFEAKAGIVSSTAAVIKFDKIIKDKFGFYYAKSFEKYLKDQTTGAGIPHVDAELITNCRYVFPNIDQQEKIVNYLNKQTSAIDQIIEKKQKLIELFREKRTAVINHAMNGGDWAQEKLKYVAPQRGIKLNTAPLDQKYIGLEHIESGMGKLIDLEESLQPESAVDVFKSGDVLFGKLRPYLAKVYTPDFDGVCSGEFLTLIPEKEKITSRFLFYKLISKDFTKAVDDSTYGTKMPRANWQFIGNQMISYPTINEQIKIVDFLNRKMQVYEKLTVDINRSIELLQELKSSLISNVVTGKVRV